MKNTVTLFFVLVMLIAACNDPFLDTPYVERTNENLTLSNAEYLVKYSDKYSLWIELLKYADFFNALNDATNISKSTVFAPDNAAVEKFLQWKGVSSVQELDKEYAKYVAQVHIMKGTLQETTFIQNVENGSIPEKTLFGSYHTLSFGYKNTDVDDEILNNVNLDDSLSIYINNQAKVAELGRADLTANGIVYTMNDVIRPLSETIVEKLKAYGEYTIFIQALEKTGYDKIVSVYVDTVLNDNGSISITDVRFTCFGVTNEVYNNAGIQSVEGLISHLNAGADYTNPQNALYQYAAYHFMDQALQKSTLSDFDTEGEIKIFDTQLSGNVITVKSDNGILKINDTATFVRSNIKARNGIIHKIDNILNVIEPKPIRVIWDFCNSADIESFVNAYGAAKGLGDLFSSPISNKEYQIDLSEDMLEGNFGTITSFDYLANAAKTSAKSWRKVGYFKCSYVSSTDYLNNKYGANMDNLFILNLGYAGNITLKTPTIIKGKYKVKIYYAGAPGLRTFYANGSNTRFNLDDYQKSIYMWKGIPATFVDPAKQTNINANGIAADVLWDEVTFEASGVHTFKATLLDINAKTNSSYRQMWDYLEFIPIE